MVGDRGDTTVPFASGSDPEWGGDALSGRERARLTARVPEPAARTADVIETQETFEGGKALKVSEALTILSVPKYLRPTWAFRAS